MYAVIVVWIAVHCGTLRQDSRRHHSTDTLETWWVWACLLMVEPSYQELVMPRRRSSISGTSGS